MRSRIGAFSTAAILSEIKVPKNAAHATFFGGAWLQLGTAVTGQGPPSTTIILPSLSDSCMKVGTAREPHRPLVAWALFIRKTAAIRTISCTFVDSRPARP
jgi:hypothetical protein